MKDRNEMEIIEMYEQKWNNYKIWTYDGLWYNDFFKRNEMRNIYTNTQNLSWAGALYTALVTILKHELSWKIESSHSNKQFITEW